jgi:predicted nucleic acid-binding protein
MTCCSSRRRGPSTTDGCETSGSRSLASPQGLDPAFRALTRQRQAAPKAWADAYLAAFAEAAQITLTFDRAFRGTGKPVVVLEAD